LTLLWRYFLPLFPVSLLTCPTLTQFLPFLEVDTIATLTHPANYPARIAHNQSKIRDIFYYNCPSTNKGVLPNCYTTDNGAVRAKSCTAANQRGTQFVHTPDGTAR